MHESAFVHPQANVTGDVWIGRDVYIGPGAVLRGDWGRITIGPPIGGGREPRAHH